MQFKDSQTVTMETGEDQKGGRTAEMVDVARAGQVMVAEI